MGEVQKKRRKPALATMLLKKAEETERMYK